MSPGGNFDYSEKRSFASRFGFAIGLVVVAAVAVALVSQVFRGRTEPPRKPTEVVMIRPLAPPPPPPPPPPPQTVLRQVDEQTMVTEQDMKPLEQPDDPTPSLGTGITGSGPDDAFGLGGRDKGFIAGSGRSGGYGSRFGGYFGDVVRAVTAALGQNERTRNASFNVRVRIWSDSTGRISRVTLADSTGDPALDRAIRGDVLVGCQLPDAPSGMKMPLELRLNLRRPN